jgi:3-methyladenine DNA glycosylase/8-oxoguanine DNA glycosylase
MPDTLRSSTTIAPKVLVNRAYEALAHLQRLPGIGPFSAQLILIRGAGHPDVFPSDERRLHEEIRP